MSNGPKYPFGEGKTRSDQKAKKCREAGGTWQDGMCVFPEKEKKTHTANPPPKPKTDR